MKLFAVHLLNDFSGSPKVLSQLVKVWKEKHELELLYGGANEGFLSSIEGVTTKTYWYRFYQFIPFRILALFISQLLLGLYLLRKARKEDIIYVNTVLPFGAALAGKLKGCSVLYHIHESSMKPLVFKKFLFKIAEITADEAIYVSNYVAQKEAIPGVKSITLYNGLESDFLDTAKSYVAIRPTVKSVKNILMICSLKDYKGVKEYVKLAEQITQCRFVLVLNATKAEIDTYFSEIALPDNLLVFDRQKIVHPFYRKADLVLNLSRPDGWVETFGLTVIEAMAYELPVIVPPVGGIAEIVQHEKNGLKADSRNFDELLKTLKSIVDDFSLYKSLQQGAKVELEKYLPSTFNKQAEAILKR